MNYYSLIFLLLSIKATQLTFEGNRMKDCQNDIDGNDQLQ